MEKQIKKITRITLACFIIGLTLSACENEGDEIFDSLDLKEESATDETREKKTKPTATISND